MTRPVEAYRRCLLPCLVLSLVSMHGSLSFGEDPAVELYATKIKPLLSARCYACHGALKQEASLRLDTAKLIRTGGDSGSAISSASSKSLLIERVTAGEGERMPPEGAPLTQEEVALLRQWIDQGAPRPSEEQPESAPTEHWAFLSPSAATIPANQHPVDYLLTTRRGDLPVADPIDNRRLLRRVYLDLIGLPPTLAQQRAFLADTRPDAYERVIDELLASPQYGERWGRHWMDIWRYTDWYGLGKQLRNSQKHIWHWRDWIIESLNDDLGYDEMLRLMLAADELRPTDAQAIRATGFLARNYYLFNRTTWLDSTIEHTSKAMLGLTLNCAKCHDHKYDPLTQREYYEFRAIFEPHQVRLDPAPGQMDLEVDGLPRSFDAHPDAKTFLHIRGDEKQPDNEALSPGVPAILGGRWEAASVQLPVTAYRPELREHVKESRLTAAETAVEQARQQLERAKTRLEQVKSTEPPPAPTEGKVRWTDGFDDIDTQRWLAQGDWKANNGYVEQRATGAERRSLRSIEKHAADFSATLKFTTTGGDKWRSVGIAFDVNGDKEKMVYMSAVKPGSKLQVSYKNPQQVYPTDGKLDREIQINTPYELTLVVQGPIIHVLIDGEFALSYKLPIAREAGHFELIAFDAQVKIDEFTVRELPANTQLSATPTQMLSPEAASRELELAHAKLRTAETKLARVHAAYSAAAAAGTDDDSRPLRMEAAIAFREHELAQAEEGLLAAQHAKQAAGKKADTKDLDKKVADAKAAVAKAKAARQSPGETYILERAGLKALEGPAESDADRRAPFPSVSTGRRAALAHWVTHRSNPLTARVAVNHIWLRHLGQPLVESVTDFGRRADTPTQQPLLDYLAVDLMENNWSMKRLHRLICTSAAYRRSSTATEVVLAGDPNNQLYTHRRPMRMESEVLRDSLLTLAGALDDTMGGPPVPPTDKVSFRRSLYFTHSRDAQHGFLSMFDHADFLRCYRRQESIVPQQALALANSALSLEMSRRLARRLHPEFPNESEFLHAAFHSILCSDPSDRELQLCKRMLESTREAIAASHPDPALREQRARENLIHALINHNDFLTIR